MKTADLFIDSLEMLTESELRIISEKILCMLHNINGNSSEESSSVPVKCPKCGSEHIGTHGKDARGKRRYRCKSCNATFTNTSFSVLSNSTFGKDTWLKYIELLLKKVSLRKTAVLCGISLQTAFFWRHKILRAIQPDQDNRVLAGIVEVDEQYISINYKGNHTKSANFSMPRAPYKRGTDNRSQVGSKACVMCAVERNGQTYGEVLGKGQPTTRMLSHAFDNRILSDSIVISDKSSSIGYYFNTHTTIDLIQLEAHTIKKGKVGPPEIRGSMHIQTVNNLHYRFRTFLRGYNGVATKYLNHYLTLFIWLENHKQNDN
ncbi:MAG: IS1595 family transposase, partial [Clostridia bacterium]|nr:IS1595 family transposase [Clostridia bacterium]